jgi:hypothetical protein
MKSVKPQWLVLGAMVSSIIFVIGFQVFNFEPINVSPNSTIITSKLIYIEQSDDLATKILNENGAILVEYPRRRAIICLHRLDGHK